MTRIRKTKSQRKGLWEVKFILSGLPLPEDEVVINDKLRFVRLSEEEENLRLPARAFVKVIGISSQVRSLAERYLKDFVGLYSNMVRSVIRIIRDDGASELPSEFVPAGTKYLGSRSRLITVVAVSPLSQEELNENMKLAAKMMGSINLNSKGKSYLRIALDYFLKSKLAEEIGDKLINGMIAVEALFGQKDELKYRISHRVACLLGKSDDSRGHIFCTMRTLYNKRSDLVHGRKTDVSWDDVRALQSYLRDSIDRFIVLSQSKSRDSILEVLDNAVVNNRKRKQFQKECEELLQKAQERM